MKRVAKLAVLALVMAGPSFLVAQHSFREGEHIEVGAFADYFRFSAVNPAVNYVGLGGRAALNLSPYMQLEAEMSYDFERNYTTLVSNGGITSFATTNTRPLTGLFGPKFQAGTSTFRAFVTGKVGFVSFSSTTRPASGVTFTNAVNNVPYGNTDVAFYPGAGVEGFFGPIGLRLDVGDEIFLSNGVHDNLRVTFGPQFRF